MYESCILCTREGVSFVIAHQAFANVTTTSSNPVLVAPLIMRLPLGATKTTIGEDVLTFGELGVTTVVVAEAVVVASIVVRVAIRATNIILLGIRVHMHQVYLLLIVLVLS